MAKVNNNKKSGNKRPQNTNNNYKRPTKVEAKKVTELTYIPNMTAAEVAEGLNITNAMLIKKLMQLGMMASINQPLDRETIELIALEMDIQVVDEEITDQSRFDEIVVEDDPADLVKRPPIITIMGHVDHGKTTLLDAFRKSRVVESESGGITQHIGAYQVVHQNEKISFIDTPGHAAFTEMRARGAKVTDIIILVVAADDGVMPQTIEALEHAKAAKVPIIVAVNKMDKAAANPDVIMSELSNYGLTPEAWGGDTPYVKISALKGEGLDELLDVILLISEINEFKANPNRKAQGSVIEARLDKSLGPVATIIVQNGTLHTGDYLVCGNTYGRIRAMTDELNKRHKEAGPSRPIEITGLNGVPYAGDVFQVFENEKAARQAAEAREERSRQVDFQQLNKPQTLDSLFNEQEEETKELRIVLKCDVHGSIEAIRGLLNQIVHDGFHVNIVRSGVGAISENDVSLARASDAVIIGFNVRPTADVRNLASDTGIEIRTYSVIYRIAEDIDKAIKGMLEPSYEEVVIGQAEVRETFKISKIGTIAGCYVTDGIIKNNSLVRVIREGVVIYTGELSTLKRFKDDVKEVRTGYECGLSVVNYNDIKVGDIIEASQMKEVEVD